MIYHICQQRLAVSDTTCLPKIKPSHSERFSKGLVPHVYIQRGKTNKSLHHDRRSGSNCTRTSETYHALSLSWTFYSFALFPITALMTTVHSITIGSNSRLITMTTRHDVVVQTSYSFALILGHQIMLLNIT